MVQIGSFHGKKLCGIQQDTSSDLGPPGVMGVIHPDETTKSCPSGYVVCSDLNDTHKQTCVKEGSLD